MADNRNLQRVCVRKDLEDFGFNPTTEQVDAYMESYKEAENEIRLVNEIYVKHMNDIKRRAWNRIKDK